MENENNETERQIALKNLIADEFNDRKQKAAHPFKHTVGWPLYDENELYAALDSLLDLNLSQGPHVRSFEKTHIKNTWTFPPEVELWQLTLDRLQI